MREPIQGSPQVDRLGEKTDKAGVDEGEIDGSSCSFSVGTRHRSSGDQTLLEFCSVGDISEECDMHRRNLLRELRVEKGLHGCGRGESPRR